MKIDLSIYDIESLLLKGSTNQRIFIKELIKDEIVEEAFKALEEVEAENYNNFDLLGWLNGGVLKYEKLSDYLEENFFTICLLENDEIKKGLVFY